MLKLYKKPLGEEKTAKEWAKELEYPKASYFQDFYHKCKNAGRIEHAFLPKEERSKRRYQGRKTAVKVKYPVDGKYYKVTDAAKIACVTPNTFYRRIRDYGVDDTRLWQKRISRNKDNYNEIRDAERELNVNNIKIGSWERKYLL